MTRTRARMVGLLTAFIAATTAPAQTPGAGERAFDRALESSLSTLPVRRYVDAVESEGAVYPRGGVPDTARLRSLSGVPGSPDRRCVSAPPTRSYAPTIDSASASGGGVRTGDFVIGASLNQLATGRPGKIHWVPLHDPSLGGNGLLVRGARVDKQATGADTVRIAILDYRWPTGSNTGAFFPSSFTLPTAGTWLLVATSGEDWGCLVLVVGDAI